MGLSKVICEQRRSKSECIVNFKIRKSFKLA